MNDRYVITDRVIKKSVLVKSSLDQVWEKWTTHEGLKSFFGYDNNFSLEIGGPFEILMLKDAPDGLKGSEGCKVLSYLPKAMLSFSWNAPPKFETIRNHEHYCWVVLRFEALSESETLITLDHLGWLEGELWDQVYDYFDQAWDVVFRWFVDSI
jgi:uncharacterized protein YndB with AHSA1/START domain